MPKASLNKGVLTYGLPSSSPATKKGFVGCSWFQAGTSQAKVNSGLVKGEIILYYIFIRINAFIFIQQWWRGGRVRIATSGSAGRGADVPEPVPWWVSGPSARCFGRRGFPGFSVSRRGHEKPRSFTWPRAA